MRRQVLPIPERKHVGVTTYVATDPDTSYPPIVPLRPPEGAPNVLVVLLDDVGFGASSAFGGPCETPTAERLAARRAEVHALPHDRAVLADARGAAVGPEPPHGRDGRDHRDGDVGARATTRCARTRARRWPRCSAQRLLDGAVRQVPRGAGVRVQPDRAVRSLAASRRRVRVLLRVHRRREQPVVSGALRADHAGRAVGTPEEGYHLMADLADRAILWMRQQKSMAPGQAVLRVLRDRRHARAAPRPEGMGRQVQGQVRPRLGRAARGDVRSPEGARRDPARLRADRPPRGDPRLGGHRTRRCKPVLRARWRSTPPIWSTRTITSGG